MPTDEGKLISIARMVAKMSMMMVKMVLIIMMMKVIVRVVAMMTVAMLIVMAVGMTAAMAMATIATMIMVTTTMVRMRRRVRSSFHAEKGKSSRFSSLEIALRCCFSETEFTGKRLPAPGNGGNAAPSYRS